MASGSSPSNAAPSSAPVAKATMNGSARVRARSGHQQEQAGQQHADDAAKQRKADDPGPGCSWCGFYPYQRGHASRCRLALVLHIAAIAR